MKEKKYFICSECGYKSPKWLGRCPNCEEWNTFEEKTDGKESPLISVLKTDVEDIQKLSEVLTEKADRILTGINEFDRVTGGGIVKDSLIILTSPPGGGKSTLSLTILNEISKKGKKTLYATGEESVSQVKNRADRILDEISENLWIISDNSMNNVLGAIDKIDPDVIVIDSIQTFSLKEFSPARAGNPTQTMECANELLKNAKNSKRPRSIIIIGQMNKSDELAGLRSLEHIVDTVLILEGNEEEELRSIISTKNRFGRTGEMGFFKMTEKGLYSIDNPSEYFITKRSKDEQVCGSSISVIREGSRPIITEIESLVSNSYTPYPSRIGEALRREHLNTIISILEQRGKINLYDKNVVIKTTGGIKLREQATNLAVMTSIASSVYNKPIPSGYAFIADVGLTGELKKVPSLELRVKELDRMGFERVFVSKNSGIKNNKIKIEVTECKNIQEVLNILFT